MDDDTLWGEGVVSVRVRVRVREGGKNGGRKDCIEEKRGGRVGGREKITE